MTSTLPLAAMVLLLNLQRSKDNVGKEMQPTHYIILNRNLKPAHRCVFPEIQDLRCQPKWTGRGRAGLLHAGCLGSNHAASLTASEAAGTRVVPPMEWLLGSPPQRRYLPLAALG